MSEREPDKEVKESEPGHPDVLEQLGYEKGDVVITGKSVTVQAVGFLVFIAFSLIASWLFLTLFDRVGAFKADRPEPGVRRTPPPETPLLQTNRTAHKDMIDLRKVENEKLHAYGASAVMPGKAVIPVEDAKKIVVERGLPTRADARPPEDYGR